MSDIYRFPDLALGELERGVLEVLWTHGPLNPGAVHECMDRVGGSSVKTVSSALKRLHQKGLLGREKVSHAYVYRPLVSRAELQRKLISGIADQFGDGSVTGFLAAFIDLAEERGDDTLQRLERMIAERIHEADE